MSVGENIKKYRKEKGITQTQLGKIIGKSLRMIQKYEAVDNTENSVTPSIELLQKIAEALEIPINSLLESPGSWYISGEGLEVDMDEAAIEKHEKYLNDQKRIEKDFKHLIEIKVYELFKRSYLLNKLDKKYKMSPDDFIYKDKYFFDHLYESLNDNVLNNIKVYSQRIQNGENSPAKNNDLSLDLFQKMHDPKYLKEEINISLKEYIEKIRVGKDFDMFNKMVEDLRHQILSIENDVLINYPYREDKDK